MIESSVVEVCVSWADSSELLCAADQEQIQTGASKLSLPSVSSYIQAKNVNIRIFQLFLKWELKNENEIPLIIFHKGTGIIKAFLTKSQSNNGDTLKSL